MSDGPPMWDRRITKACFRTCSTCRCCSQAPFCLCTLRQVSDLAEGTFARLRYCLGGDRPSQTPHQTVSPTRGLGIQNNQGGISTLAPSELAPGAHSLPPILHKLNRMSLPS